MYTGTIYNTKTGYIVSTCRSTQESDLALQCTINPDYRLWAGEELGSLGYYFENDQPVARPIMQTLLVNGTEIDFESDEDHEFTFAVGDVLSVTGILDGTELAYPGDVIIVDDGFFEWSTDDEGEYRFYLFLSPYKRVTINAIFA